MNAPGRLSDIKRWLKEELSDFPVSDIQFVKSGFDNENYLLDGQYVLRIPKTENSTNLIQNEIQWLPRLVGKFDIEIPEVILSGHLNERKPYAIYSWIDGETAMTTDLKQSEWPVFIKFLKKLHGLALEKAPSNPLRGLHLNTKSERFFGFIDNLTNKTSLKKTKIIDVWETALSTPLPQTKHLIHGDLHADNMILYDGHFAGVIDWGDITAGDPSTDLASLWMLIDNPDIREMAFESYGADSDMKFRAMGWALFFALVFLDYGFDNNEHYFKMGNQITQRVFKDFQRWQNP